MQDYHKLTVWTKSLELVKDIYQITTAFPKTEFYGLSNQIQRAAVSIPSNIAEGSSRSSKNDYIRFLEIALGSAYEVETQLRISKELNYISENTFNSILDKIDHIQRQLVQFIKRIRETLNA